MNIYEATKLAIEKDCCITTEQSKGVMKIKPTNDVECCIIMNVDGGNPSKRGWQPTADDLIAMDWIVTE